MARRTITIDEKIEKAEAAVAEAKKKQKKVDILSKF